MPNRLPVANDATTLLELMGQLDVAIERSASFLLRSSRTMGSTVGWPLYEGAPDLANWGGTLDALRALARANYLSYSPIISEAQAGLLRSQHEDGGWGSWEIYASNVETTAWTLIALRAIGQHQTQTYAAGIAYLRSVKHPTEPAWGAYLNASLRLYPTITAAWALSESDPQLSRSALTWVLSKINQDGGFGYSPNSATVPSLSALYIVACDACNFLLSPTDHERILNNLISNIHDNWTWDSDFEEWVAVEDTGEHRSVPNQCCGFAKVDRGELN